MPKKIPAKRHDQLLDWYRRVQAVTSQVALAHFGLRQAVENFTGGPEADAAYDLLDQIEKTLETLGSEIDVASVGGQR